jgi:hypothetical protein
MHPMQANPNPNPKPRAADNPMGSAILGSLLVREGTRDNDPATVQAGHKLLQAAQDHWPHPIPQDKRLV